MEGVGFYCRVYYCWRVSLRLGCEQRWWFTTLVLTRLSILCWENITDSYLDDCFTKPCSWEEGWFVWWSRKRIFQQRFIDTPLVLIKQTDCELLLNAALGKSLKWKQLLFEFSNAVCSPFSFFLLNIWWSLRYIETNLHRILIQLLPISCRPRGITCYWEKMTMSTTSTVIQCVCPCETFHSGSPMTLLRHKHIPSF